MHLAWREPELWKPFEWDLWFMLIMISHSPHSRRKDKFAECSRAALSAHVPYFKFRNYSISRGINLQAALRSFFLAFQWIAITRILRSEANHLALTPSWRRERVEPPQSLHNKFSSRCTRDTGERENLFPRPTNHGEEREQEINFLFLIQFTLQSSHRCFRIIHSGLCPLPPQILMRDRIWKDFNFHPIP